MIFFIKKMYSTAQKFMSPKEVDVVYYHTPSLNGLTTSWVVDHYSKEIERIPYSVPGGCSEEGIQRGIGKNVIFLGCCPQMKQYTRMALKGTKVMMLLSEKNKVAMAIRGVNGIFFFGHEPPCMIAWKYFQGFKPYPPLLPHLGSRMAERRTEVDEAIEMAISRLAPRSIQELDIYLSAGERSLELLINIGEAAKKEDIGLSLKIEKIDFEGHRVLLVEATESDFLNKQLRDLCERHPDCDYAIGYFKVPTSSGVFRYRLFFRTRKDGIRVSEISQKYGGGGQGDSAGATVNKLPWVKEEEPKWAREPERWGKSLPWVSESPRWAKFS